MALRAYSLASRRRGTPGLSATSSDLSSASTGASRTLHAGLFLSFRAFLASICQAKIFLPSNMALVLILVLVVKVC